VAENFVDNLGNQMVDHSLPMRMDHPDTSLPRPGENQLNAPQAVNPKNPENDRKIVKHVVAEFERYEGYWSDTFTQAEQDYDNWIGVKPKRDYEWQNQIHVPLTFEGEQTITPRIFTALFPNDAPVDLQTEGDADEEQGIKIKHLIQHFFRVADVQGEAVPLLQQNTLYGTGYMEGGAWYVKRGWQLDQDGKRYYTIIESRPDCKHIDFFEMFPHPNKLRVEDEMPVIRRRFIDGEKMKAMMENPFFKFENVEDALNSTLPDPTGKTGQTPKHYMPKKGERYEMLDYWGPWDDEAKLNDKVVIRKQVPYWIIIINRKVKIRCTPNPYNHQTAPFIKTKFYEDSKPSWFGLGLGKVGMASQERVNKIVNTRLDNVDLILNKQGAYNGNDPLINVKKLQVSKPGLWHKVSDVASSLHWIETPDVTQSAYIEEEKAKGDFREATGSTSSIQPADDVGDQHRTAMGIQLLQGAAGMRFRPVLRRLEKDFIQQLAMFFFSNLNQFMTSAEWVEVTGENGVSKPVQVHPEDIQARVFFIPTGISETLNKEVQVGQLLRFKEVTANDPTINRAEINKRIAELLGFKDIQKLLVPQASGPGAAGPGEPLPTDQKETIRRRVAEGASPDQIKMELLGPHPMAGMQGQQQ
jgi:hypothetical protein